MDLEDNALGLTQEQTDKILQFQDLTGIEDMSICRDVLQRHQWDLEVTIIYFPYRKLSIVFRSTMANFMCKSVLILQFILLYHLLFNCFISCRLQYRNN